MEWRSAAIGAAFTAIIVVASVSSGAYYKGEFAGVCADRSELEEEFWMRPAMGKPLPNVHIKVPDKCYALSAPPWHQEDVARALR